MLEFPPIYPITDKELAHKKDHLSILKELARGGASLVQIRDKSTPANKLLADLLRCADFASGRNLTLIIDDRCDLVLSCGADGVHLGLDDLPPKAARSILGEKCIIGYSMHSVSRVRNASSLPIQYIGFGPVFATMTKRDAKPPVGLKKLELACRISTLPVVAIGGIGLSDIPGVLDSGAASAAVISALMSAPDIARRMEEFMEAAMGR